VVPQLVLAHVTSQLERRARPYNAVRAAASLKEVGEPEPTGDGQPLPLPPWLAPRSGGRQGLDRGEIVEAALRLARRESLSALSMRRLGAELGAGATSLYWHVRDKAQLVDLVADRIVAEIEVPTEGHWRERVMELARRARRVFLTYPGSAQYLAQHGAMGPAAIAMHESAMAILAEGGVPVALLWDAYLSLLTYLIAQLQGEAWAMPEVDPERARQLMEWLAAVPEGRLPHVMAVAAVTRMSLEERFEFGLACFLDGLEAVAEPRERS